MKDNPYFPFIVRECAKAQPTVMIRYGKHPVTQIMEWRDECLWSILELMTSRHWWMRWCSKLKRSIPI